MGQLVKDSIQPQFEVVHFVDSPEAGLSDIPMLVLGNQPFGSVNSVGTGNLSKRPLAIIVGATYDDVWIETVRRGLKNLEIKVPILKPNRESISETISPVVCYTYASCDTFQLPGLF
ncbi:hypothetical protein F5X99DRAFT_395498 [Biscogniauxia marginata]|nr:hypothetical protein F5X99DRAFT_395498 [Biscogniauxia marginata]